MGGGWLLVEARDGPGCWRGALVVLDDIAIAGRRLCREDDGGLVLEDGSARAAEAAPAWSARFARARLPLAAPLPRVERAERSTPALLDLLRRMAARGQPDAAERLTLYKRTALPAAMPVLALLGLPLGARLRRPLAAGVAVALLWWGAMRLGDQFVGGIGPLAGAALPPALAALAAALAWRGWRTP